MGVSLRNTLRKPFIATMYHGIFCRRGGECRCGVQKVRSESGKLVTERQPKSFQINSGKSLTVDRAALHLPQVKKAVKDGWLVRSDLEKAQAAGKATPMSSTAGATPVPRPITPDAPAPAVNGKKKGR